MESSVSRSLVDLEWPELCEAIAQNTLSDSGRRLALALGPAPDQDTALVRLEVMSELMRLFDAGATLPSGAFVDVTASLLRIERGAAASGGEFAELHRCLEVALRLQQFGQAHEENAPLVARLLELAPELKGVRRAISESVDETGEVHSEASPELAAARRELRKIRDEIKSKMSDLIARYREALQDGYFAEREGRYVLPVRTDAPFRVEGLVLGTSGSGSTLYVEPKELAALGNRLRMAEGEVERQIAVVLARLSDEVAPHAEEIRWAQDVAARADLLRACTDVAERMKARVVDFAPSGTMQLVGARHPLLCLSLERVVPSDMFLSAEQGLVLSGPNAGGKTVALKTLGLFALMQSTGLPIPAEEGTQVAFFDEVLCDIGDDQNLSMSLSTFSGHVKRVAAMLEDAGHGSLVLFDELMGGTDPDEGAVLAISTLDALVQAGASVCATTHYEALKKHAAQAEHLQNGAVGFDFERMEPTFVVSMGRAGASSAIVVAQKHGLPAWVTARAQSLLPEVSERHRAERIELENASAEVQRERDELSVLRAQQEELNRRLERELEKQKEARRRDLTREGDALQAEVRAARAEVRRVLGQLKNAAKTDVNELQRELDKAARVNAVGGKLQQALSEPQPGKALAPAQLVVGSKVRVKGFNSPAEILEQPKKGQVRVLMGIMKMSVPLADIVGGSAPEKKPEPSLSKKERQAALEMLSVAPAPPIKSQDVILDLRGKRVEESLLEVDHFVDELLRKQERGGFVLHGHGTGALKDAVRQHLRAHSCISDSRPAERDEGGDAFTVFWLAGS